jgi:protein SCO1/2
VTFEGKIQADTIYHTIPDFSFTNQNGEVITQDTFKDKIYVADFFFTTCPTICPIMKTQMLRVYEKFKDNPEVMILSHTIDPKHDSVAVLYEFADRLGVTGNMWQFVTGDQDEIYDIGQNSYMVTAREDPGEPGGYLHSGALLLVDKERRIRGIYDGTLEEKVDILMKDIDKLLKEYHTE